MSLDGSYYHEADGEALADHFGINKTHSQGTIMLAKDGD